ncbi:U3 small nucleolar RNA-associated protein 4 [Sarcoptes scabiei]|uniref:Cirhin n=1 Tax=Sarcoptes scabiei TaxID=52283 RepID=A0A132A9H2_SARSC|nr:U3 small nucleolar RNA-associated protein 4 [Sarcoptes scabiei]KPM07602.1 hypothetical protein QR98_0061000 [Sarcoptes scabiei]
MTQSIKTHRVRFIYYQPFSINCLALDERNGRVALIRRSVRKFKPTENDTVSVIEIWNVRQKTAFLEQTINEDPDQLSLLECIGWYQGRLFSCGLNTFLNEYDLINGQISKSYCVYSDPAWCFSINPDQKLIAVGTEKGYVCLFRIYPDHLEYEKVFQKNENRILCMEWYRSKQEESWFLVIGSIDYIKIYNFTTQRCVDFIKVGNNNVIVWCLKVLSDFTIVSGDSNGTTSFWNGRTASLIQSFKAHRGDVLTLCSSHDGNQIYSAGVDPTIIQFNRCHDPSDLWVITWKRRPHTHDVRSMAFNRTWLISGGIDTFLCQTRIGASGHVNHLSNLYKRCAVTSLKSINYLAFMYEHYIQIWKLGRSDNKQNAISLDLDHGPDSFYISQLKILQDPDKTIDVHSRKPIIAFDFKSQWLIYANYSNLKILMWSEEELKKIKFLHDPLINVNNILIIDEDRCVVSFGRHFSIFRLDEFGVSLEYSGSIKKHSIQNLLCNENRLILSTSHTIHIYDLKDKNYPFLKSFTFAIQPTSFQMDPNGKKIWIGQLGMNLSQFNLETLTTEKTFRLNQYKSNENQESRNFNEHWPIKQIAFGNRGLVLLSNDNNLYAFNYEKEKLIKCDRYHHIVAMKNIIEDRSSSTDSDGTKSCKRKSELIIVEMTHQAIMATLPPMLKTKTFGIG